ncbi:MAG TPA: radical SAM protein [Spirochaetota bacterium]|nr:radical SAM protein [Spirochaetota bacterium]HRZ27651.1 radical SAM protein [Spirochaetota bacterium]
MKKVLLVNSNTEKMPYPVPPIGLCLLAARLQDKYHVEIYDGVFDEGAGLAEKIGSFRPDYIGLSIRNIDDMDMSGPTTYLDLIEKSFVAAIKDASSAPLILGGSGFSMYAEYLMKRFGADYGVFGEAEETLPLLLDALDRGERPALPGLLTGSGGCLTRPGTYYDFSSAPSADIDLRVDFNPYRARGAYGVQTKRGCAHRCIYCTYTHIEGGRFRTRSAVSVADEIESACRRLGQVTFEFVDSTFNDPPGHAEAICAEIARRKLDVRLRTMGINPANVTRELFDLMLAAGFAQIDSTPDSASPAMLKSLCKNFTLGELERAAAIIREYDMPTMWFFIFGGPGEDERTIEETFGFIDSWVSPLDMVHMTMGLRVYPHTPLYDIALAEGAIQAGDDLVAPRFYVSPRLSKESLREIITAASMKRSNCIPIYESTPPPAMMREAMEMRQREKLDEPMFRTLLRIRRRMFREQGLVP